MERNEKIIWLIFLILITTIVIQSYIIVFDQKTIEKTYSKKNITYDSIDSYKFIAMNLSKNSKYVLHDYDCSNMSKDLKKRLNEIGYKADTIVGIKGIAHMWVVCYDCENETIYLESTNGYTIKESELEKYYSENKLKNIKFGE